MALNETVQLLSELRWPSNSGLLKIVNNLHWEAVISAKKTRVRRTFTEEFKRDAVNGFVVEGNSSKSAAAGVSSRSLRGWHEKFALEPEPCGDDALPQRLIFP